MPKPDRDTLLRQGEELLQSWGVAADAAPAALAACVGRQPAADVAIAERLGRMAEDASVEPLRRLESESSDKLVRKEAKRSLYRLQQRGLSIPEAPVDAPAPLLATTVEGYLSPVDGNGDQLVWLIKPRSGGLLHLFAVVNDPAGMREVNLAVISRKALKGLRAELAAKHELRLVEADWKYCDFLMRRAFAWARERDGRIEGDFPGLRSQLVSEPGEEELAPLALRYLDAKEIEADPSHLARSAELVEEPELRTWWLQRDRLQSYLDELKSIKDSPLVLDRSQQEERYRGVVDRSVEEIFAPPLRDSWVRRLYEMAYFLWASARPERAKAAAAAALALSKSDRGGREVPFCEVLARGSIAFFFQESIEQEAERSRDSLVMTPQQLRAMQQRKR
jgi:hypothetical protein